MNIEEAKKRIMDFMQENLFAVISTVDSSQTYRPVYGSENGNKPESAVIAFAQKENFELIFGTSNQTRKYQNLQKNPNVSFVIGWDNERGTVQYEGIARELSDAESKDHAAILIAKNPRTEKFIHKADQKYFVVKPTWIRILDMTKHPDETLELNI